MLSETESALLAYLRQAPWSLSEIGQQGSWATQESTGDGQRARHQAR